MATTGSIRVGIGGWDYEPWRETFYPADVTLKRQLEYASRQVTAIEINGTYYRTQKPETYAGEFYGPDPAMFEPGTWYFDTRDRALVYIVRFPSQFVTPLRGPPRARFAVEADYEDVDHNGRFDPGRDPVRGLKLVPLESFSWKEKQ